MAQIAELNQAAFSEWLESRPQVIKDLATRLPPNLLYMLKSTKHRVTIYSYSEDGTVTVNVEGNYNLATFERSVFGINPDDLMECDLPPEDEAVGVLLNEQEASEFINVERGKLGLPALTEQELAAARGREMH